MIEFGSDFNLIDIYNSGEIHLADVFRGDTLLANGRQCITVLILQYGCRRLWIPDYFCNEVIDTIKRQTGVEIKVYADSPLFEGNIEELPFKEGDVLLRMNFFGMKLFRSNMHVPVPVIEDHSHAPLGYWALNSDADWCVSSLRKTFPLPEGGILWSPKGHVLKFKVPSSDENEKIAAIRWNCMEMKARYLKGKNVSKEDFRKKYTETENWFDMAKPSLIDTRSKLFLEQFNFNLWFKAKQDNWTLLREMVNHHHQCQILEPDNKSCSMFSLVLLFESQKRREFIRRKLIESSVYPAILWNVPETASAESRNFSERMLSIHCDGRYKEGDIRQLADILNQALE